MDSFIPIGSFKRDEIYSFLGGFFIALSWYIYYTNLSCDISASSIDLVTNPIFLILWLFSTAVLYTIQILMVYFASLAIGRSLKNKNQTEKKKILNIKDPVEDFIPAEFVNEIKIHVHIIGIIITSMLLSLFPLYQLSSMLTLQNIYRRIPLILVALALIGLLYFFAKFLKMFIVIHLLKAEGSLEIIDQNTYAQKRATYIADVKNEESKRKLQNYLDQQKHG
jgi:hypothetical protein